jgi:hypothetical protein
MFDQANTSLPSIHFRYLKHDDYDKYLFPLLSQLTKAP